MNQKELLVTTFFLGLFALLSAQPNSGLPIMQSYQDALRVEDLQGVVAYRNISRKGRIQERKLDQFIKRQAAGENVYSFLLRFTAPLDIKGTGTLTVQHLANDDDQWLYLPAIRSAKRISPSRKTDRFMGTEITFEDLSNYLSESLENYNYQLLEEKKRGEEDCYVIEATPTDAQEKANSGYAKRILWITKNSLVNVYTEFFDKKGQMLKTYEAWNIQQVGDGHFRPFNAKLANLQTKNSTEIIYSDIRINKSLDDEIFSRQHLENP